MNPAYQLEWRVVFALRLSDVLAVTAHSFWSQQVAVSETEHPCIRRVHVYRMSVLRQLESTDGRG